MLRTSHRHGRQDHAGSACRDRRRLGSNRSRTGHPLGRKLVAGDGTAAARGIDAAVAQAMTAAAGTWAGRRWCRARSAEGLERQRARGIAALLALTKEEEGGAEVAAGKRVLEHGEGHALKQRQALLRRHGVELAAGLEQLLELGLGEESLDLGQRGAFGTGGLGLGPGRGRAGSPVGKGRGGNSGGGGSA